MAKIRKTKRSSFAFQTFTATQLLVYLSHKQTGGASFAKGYNYEATFALKNIAEAADVYFELGIDADFKTQCPGYFVDDLVIETPNTINCFQLKNKKFIQWGRGRKGSLAFDFAYQLRQPQSKLVDLCLVVPSVKVARRLAQKKPITLSSCSVLAFPAKNFVDLIKDGDISDSLSKIANSSNPPFDRLVQIAKLLLANWMFCGGNSKISSLLSVDLQPFIRSSQPNHNALSRLRPKVAGILSGLPHFKYSIDRGFFHCVYGGTTYQSLAFDCFSSEFDTVQDWIEQNAPSQFPGDFERMMNTWSKG